MTDPLADLSDLDIDLSPLPLGRGRRPRTDNAEYVRELTSVDLATPPVATKRPPAIHELRASHHALARCLSTGMREAEASLVTGYSPSRISILKADPQFQQLMAYYADIGASEEVVADLRKRMHNLGADALEVVQARINDDPDSISTALLRDIIKDMADRTGYAPPRAVGAATQININVADAMASARARVQAKLAGVGGGEPSGD